MQSLKLTPELITKLDLKEPSPTDRALKVIEKVKDISQYDLTCFCIIYLTGIAETMPYLLPPVRELNKMFHFAHYDTLCRTSDQELNKTQSDGITSGLSSDLEKSLSPPRDLDLTKM